MDMPADLSDLIVHERVGKGSYGSVYRGVVYDDGCSVEVAAKVMPLDASDVEAVQREALLQHEAGRHPAVVKLLGCFHHEDSAWLVLELCACSVYDLIRRDEKPLEETPLLLEERAEAEKRADEKPSEPVRDPSPSRV